MQGQTNTFSKSAANTLRKEMTDAERALWHKLRGEQLGVKFRRQHAFEGYILDFVCVDAKLVIEVDGSQHMETQQHDERRTRLLEQSGFRVLRFWNNQVLNEMDGVLQTIWIVLNQASNPSPSTHPTLYPSPPQPSP